MFTIKKLVSLMMAVLLVFTLTACADKNAENHSEDSGEGFSKKSEYNYLTGLKTEEGEDSSARPVAIMINNIKVALPQSGLDSADIIYEAVTEGGITRLMAVYSDINKIEKAGPVRSARDQFIEMMLPLNAIYVHIGASASAERMLNFYSYQDIDGIYLGTTAFEQDAEIAATKAPEHSWFTNKDLIKAGIDKENIVTKNDFYPAFDFVSYKDPARVISEDVANNIEFKYSDYADVSFNYDAETGKYSKYAFGIPHMDAETNTQISFDNVFVLVTKVGVQEENGILPDFEFEEGKGYYFNGGRYEEITWKKGEPEQPLILMNENGSVLKVNPGKSYIGIISEEMLETLNISEEVQSTANVERVQ